MGFWQGMVRMVKGEPVFQPSEKNQKYSKQTTQTDPYVQQGHKIIPEVHCEQIEWHEDGDDHREVWATIANRGQVDVMIDKIAFLGSTIELNHHLQPGQEREFNIYKGDKLDNRSYTKAELYFRLPNGDYFCADHQILYQVKGDGESEVKELRLIRPIRDV